ncbi:MAG: UDP-N-acetylglucosamine 2-epimerase (non-hydrolyzing) [Candidatus Muiribacteriota bacterium]
MKIATVFGTRPEAIKMAPLVLKLKEKNIENKVIVTAQHREMLDQVLNIFNIKPDYDLNIMKPGQDIFDITVNVMLSLKKVFFDEKFDLILVHGDTTTTMAASMAAYYLKIPVGHVEAGLRTWNKYSPFPEEMNRKITGCVSDIHFAPTSGARDNLIKENVSISDIYVTGNTVIDALFTAKKHIDDNILGEKFDNIIVEKTSVDFFNKKFVLITGHRRENFGEGFKNVFEAYIELAQKYRESLNFLYPVHLNPNVKNLAENMLSGISNFFLIEPVDYLQFINLMYKSHIIITDSGGVQEEAPAFGKPVLVTREHTERPEAVEAGTVRLVGCDKNKIIEEFTEIYENKDVYEKMSKAHNPYGDGFACDRIADALRSFND